MSRARRDVVRPLIRSMQRVARTMHTAVWSAYRAAGMPYGETEEGLLRWLREQGEAQAARDEVEREAYR